MSPRFLAPVAAALLLSPACSTEAPDEESRSPAAIVAPDAFSGTFRVSGHTVEVGSSGRGRDIEGTVVIAQDGDAYTASYELTTLFPTPDGPSQAQVVGTGRGSVSGSELQGTADTQIILAQVPGVAADFAFLPRTYGPRITSRSTARLDPDGTLTIEIESQGVRGETYRPTRTTVRGVRLAAATAAAEE